MYASVNLFLHYTRDKVHEHNDQVAKKCFRLADKLYRHGDRAVKRAVENVFVFSLSSVLQSCGRERPEVLPLVPRSLRNVYLKQVLHQHGC